MLTVLLAILLIIREICFQIISKIKQGKETAMTLENKLSLIGSLDLAKAEEKISKARASQLFEDKVLGDKKAGTYATLAFIHQFLFEELYDFAGQVRTVNLAKGNFRFAPVMYLAASL